MSEAVDPHVRLRVAIYDPDGAPRALMSGAVRTIEANVPPGGSWSLLPSHVRRLKDVRRNPPA